MALLFQLTPERYGSYLLSVVEGEGLNLYAMMKASPVADPLYLEQSNEMMTKLKIRLDV